VTEGQENGSTIGTTHGESNTTNPATEQGVNQEAEGTRKGQAGKGRTGEARRQGTCRSRQDCGQAVDRTGQPWVVSYQLNWPRFRSQTAAGWLLSIVKQTFDLVPMD